MKLDMKRNEMETLLETIQMEDLYIQSFPLKDSLIVPLESCVICAITQDLFIDGDAQLSPSSDDKLADQQ